MSASFNYLEKHYCATDSAQIAAQLLLERYSLNPRPRSSAVVYATDWNAWTASIANAVRAYSDPSVASPNAVAKLNDRVGHWNIFLSGLRYVHATRLMESGRSVYRIDDYHNGTVEVVARVLPGTPLQMGDVLWFQTVLSPLQGPVDLPPQ
ncbi:hypothetical protein V1318_16555 [Lysobacter sp. CCNWLW3]